jgi:hypothetical protein
MTQRPEEWDDDDDEGDMGMGPDGCMRRHGPRCYVLLFGPQISFSYVCFLFFSNQLTFTFIIYRLYLTTT